MGVWNGMNNIRIPLSSWKFAKVKPTLRQFRATPLFTFFPCDRPETKWSAIKVIRISIDFLRNQGADVSSCQCCRHVERPILPPDFDLLSNVVLRFSSTSLTIFQIIFIRYRILFMYQSFIIILLNENSSLSMNYKY